VGWSLVVSHPFAATAAVVLFVAEGTVVAQHGSNARHLKELVRISYILDNTYLRLVISSYFSHLFIN
jgi:hypothetical protein